LKNVIFAIYETEILKIIVPLTVKGSCKYGQNTRWCTSATISDNKFNKYMLNGILYRFIFKNTDSKFSLHWRFNGSRKWRDEKNREYPEYDINDWLLEKVPFDLERTAKISVTLDFAKRLKNKNILYFQKYLRIKGGYEKFIEYVKNWLE